MTEATTEPDLAYIAGLTRVRAAAGAVFLDEGGGVMVVHPTYKDICELPGGSLEPDESPLEACERELKEELSFVPLISGLLCVDWVPPSPPWDGGLMFLFDGGVLSPMQIADIRLPADELDRFEFVPVGELETVLVPRLARRVLACLPMHGAGGLYLEDGVALPR
ncbi:MAG: NUDIX domain-containing protein [Pseudonocardiaceae bacterium]